MKTGFLIALAVLSTSSLRSQQVTFTDVAANVGIVHDFNLVNGVGLSFKDFNGDGWDDLTVASGTGDSIYFFLNQGGTFQRVVPALYTGTEAFKMVIWADYDNDGDQDLFLGGWLTSSKLLHNHGDLNFTEVTQLAGLPTGPWHTSGTSWGDYDRDGWLDKYITMNTVNPEPNMLFRSRGDGTFEDVTNSSGVADTFLASFCSAFLDFNNDMWPDLYVANDKSDSNRMYRNLQSGNFSNYGDSSASSIVIDAMSVTPGDYNNDGFLDIYVTNTPGGGNYLLRNNGNNTFSDVAIPTGVRMNAWCWGASWLDHDRDGDLDLYVGAESTGVPWLSSAFYENLTTDGVDSFEHLTGIGIDNEDNVSYSNATGDFNNDGWVDVAVPSESPDSFMLWRNNGGTTHNWLKVFLTGTISNRDGTGSWIHLVANGRKQVRYTMQGLGYLNQNSADEFFGIDSATTVDSLLIYWPSGISDTLLNVSANQRVVVVEDNLPIPNPVISVLGPTTFCLGSSVALDAGTWSTYQWSTGDTTQMLTVTTAGLYNVTVTNAFGVRASAKLPIEVTIHPHVTFTISSEDVTCNGASNGSAQVTVTGGTSPFSYSWSNGGQGHAISNLGPGLYSVTVTDNKGCSKSGVENITQPPVLASAVVQLTNATCNGYMDGSVDQTVSGGKLPYNYTWSNGESSQDADSLSAGLYRVTITDANGCTLVDSFTVTEPPGMSLTVDATPASCFGYSTGALDLSVSAGIQPLAYSWSSGDSVEDISALIAGTYHVTVTDSTGCNKSLSAVVSEPDSISIVGNAEDATCNGYADGSVNVLPVGGNGSFTYTWSNQATTQTVSNLAAGAYAVTVTDSLGCTASHTLSVAEPLAIALVSSSSEVTCNAGADGSVDLSASGGNGGFSYGWSTGDFTEDITGLGAGVYFVTVTDSKGCQATDSATITEPYEIILSTTTADASCNGSSDGTIDLSVTGGRGNYTFSWSNTSTAEDLAAVSAGTYEVTVTDSAGCQATLSTAVFEPATIQISQQIDDASCYGYSDGSISLQVIGGTPGYTYNWSTADTSTIVQDLNAGAYFVTVTDSAGCEEVEICLVAEPDSITLTGASADVSCFGLDDGSIDINAAGGTGSYSFLWSDSVTTAHRIALEVGSYFVSVTDSNGCTGAGGWTIAGPDEIQLAASASADTAGQGTGTATVSVEGGTAPYFYQWNDPLSQTTPTAVDLAGGTYQVVVSDDNGCTDSISVEVPEVTGVAPFEHAELLVYPNPANSILVIDGLPRETEIKVTAADGRKVFEARAAGTKEQLHVAHWPSGIYLIQLQTPGTNSGVIVVIE